MNDTNAAAQIRAAAFLHLRINLFEKKQGN